MNNKIIFKEMIKMTNFPEMGDFIRSLDLEYIGSGSSRDVFALNDKQVIKVAKNNKGLAQNANEILITRKECYNDVIAKVLGADMNKCRFTISEKVITSLKDKEEMKNVFYEYFGIPKNNIDFILESMDDPKYAHISLSYARENPKLAIFRNLMIDEDMKTGDIMLPESWGTIGKKICLKDYGLTNKTYQEFYIKRKRNGKT